MARGISAASFYAHMVVDREYHVDISHLRRFAGIRRKTAHW
jgi:hypothetical protein